MKRGSVSQTPDVGLVKVQKDLHGTHTHFNKTNLKDMRGSPKMVLDANINNNSGVKSERKPMNQIENQSRVQNNNKNGSNNVY